MDQRRLALSEKVEGDATLIPYGRRIRMAVGVAGHCSMASSLSGTTAANGIVIVAQRPTPDREAPVHVITNVQNQTRSPAILTVIEREERRPMASMTQDQTKNLREWRSRPQAPILGLLAASLIVGLAIATSGALSKAVNGVGGALWIVTAVTLGLRLRHERRAPRYAAYAFVLTLSLVLLIKPSDLVWAAIGFAVAGTLIGIEARPRQVEWAAFLAAIWLPTHLLVAISRVIVRSVRGLPANVRTDPPPTAALVPFAMVLCALIGSQIAAAIRAKQNPAG